MRRVLVSICLLSLSCCVAEFCQAQIPGVPPYPTNRDSAPQPGQIPGVPPYPMNRRPAPQPAQKPAVARAVVNYPPDRNDPIAMRCDQLADSPIDPQRIGDGVQFGQIDVKEALPACQQAAARQPARPRYQLLYGCVLHAAQRYNEAARYYALADNAGYALAAYYLGTLYDAGTGVKQDFSKASDLYFRAGNAGFADAFADGGMLYMREQQPDYAEAKRWFESAAQGGSNQGLIDLGWLYENGYGVQKDPLKGGSFYNEAAQHGDTEGMLRLGDLYLAGRGVQPDPHTACQWFFRAAKGGNAAAGLDVGDCHYYRRLHLLERYSEQVNDEIAEILADCVIYLQEGGTNASTFLNRRAAERAAVYGASHWRVVLMQALSDSPRLPVWLTAVTPSDTLTQPVGA